MTHTEWMQRAERLKKCLDYAPAGPAVAAAREALENHLKAEPAVTPDQFPNTWPEKRETMACSVCYGNGYDLTGKRCPAWPHLTT